MLSFTRLTLARQYMIVSLLVMVAGMVIIGIWISRQIETAVTNRTAAVTALYVDSYISPYLQKLTQNNEISPDDLAALENLLANASLGRQIVSFKIWSPEGKIVYSPVPELIDQTFEIEGGLAQALGGEVVSEVSDLDKSEQAFERQNWESLIETYAPVRADGSGDIIAVTEFYQTTDALATEIRNAQIRSWIVVGAVMTAVYLLLAGIVGRASHIIIRQQSALEENVAQLHQLLHQNQKLNERIRRAAARTTSLNERYLRRISADLHDGPAQDLALALLRFESLSEALEKMTPATKQDFKTVHSAIESAMWDLRTVSADLRIPAIDAMSPAEIVRRAVHDYEQKTGAEVIVTLADLPDVTPTPIKITLYRILQEALGNGYRHAAGKKQSAYAYLQEHDLCIEIADSGPGFDPHNVDTNGHLGLVGMRERVELLGGNFEIRSQPGLGTTIRVRLPLATSEEPYA